MSGGGHSHDDNLLPLETVRKIARLARLEITPQQAAAYQRDLSDVLRYVERLRELDLEGVEPLASPLETPARLGEDVPAAPLLNEDLMRLAPEGGSMPPFLRVPKVLGEGGGA